MLPIVYLCVRQERERERGLRESERTDVWCCVCFHACIYARAERERERERERKETEGEKYGAIFVAMCVCVRLEGEKASKRARGSRCGVMCREICVCMRCLRKRDDA